MLTTYFVSTLLVAAAVNAAPEPRVTQAPSKRMIERALEARSSGDGSTPLPLTQYSFPYNQIPYQVNPYQYERGPQTGYNQCNSSTENPTGQCQTLLLNTIDSFCLWGSPGTTANETIGDIEAAVVSYCTRQGLGGRIMPAGTIQAVQYMRTSAYIQISGFLNQTGLGLAEDDTGGELDPHGADLLGNPLGGLVYSNQFASSGNSSGSGNSSYGQVVEWNNFIGSGQFCFKLCFPNVTSPFYCQNKYDLIGCSYNMPSNVTMGEFTECEGDLQDEVGTYVGSNGQTSTWSQPSSLPPSSTLPWNPRMPASSNCVTRMSTDLFPIASLGYQAAAASPTTTTTSMATTGAAGGAKSSGKSDSSGAAPTQTGTSSSSSPKAGGAASAQQIAQSTGVFAGLLSLLAAFVM